MVYVFKEKALVTKDSGEVLGVRVILEDERGGTAVSLFEPDKFQLTNTELFNLAYEDNYQRNYFHRAENERFDVLDERIAQYDELVAKVNNKLQEMDKSLEMTAQQTAEYASNSEMAQATLLAIVGKLYEKGVLVDEELTETTNTEIS
ncbi:DUF1366 domain-containing protein [Streptococcus merionis]|uniref:DUF1366 domain-containing protein n=1 Tax=Streptococcus merionis TaxID=400065 RepID=UPI00351952F6